MRTRSRMVVTAALTASLAGAAAAAPAGSADNPIDVHMKRGTDSVALTGRLTQGCCAYRFKAHAGQALTWRITGPAARETLTDPDGNTDGPGLANPLPLPKDGAYVFTVRPNLMADGAFGRFTLRLKIPPAKR